MVQRTSDDFNVQTEQTIAIIRREGKPVPRPEDTRCRAIQKNGKQCSNKISYDEDGDNWSVFCKDHREADDAARAAGEPRVGRFDHKKDQSTAKEEEEAEAEAENEES